MNEAQSQGGECHARKAGFPGRITSNRPAAFIFLALLVAAAGSAVSQPVIRLKAVGDIMLARSIGRKISVSGPAAFFSLHDADLSGADLIAGNLECCISARGKPEAKRYTFRAPTEAAGALSLASFSVVSVANNHSLDYGPEAFADTLSALDAHGIAHVGGGRDAREARAPAILTRQGVRVAFLAYADTPAESGGFDARSWVAGPGKPGIAWANPADIREDVASAKRVSDIVVVFLHAGIEGSTSPSPNQIRAGRTAIEAGASLVIGSHPHVAQTGEYYGRGFIAFSLGNFIFDGFEPESQSGLLLDAKLSPGKPPAVSLVPLALR